MAKATDVLTRDAREPAATDTIMGGPGGVLSTTELVKAKADFDRYRTDDPDNAMPFQDYVLKVWKPAHSR